MIPNTIHHVWVGGPLPQRLEPIVATWRALHPEWEHVIWTDDDLGWLRHRDLYDRAEDLVPADGVGQFRANLARYEILNRAGGVYVDCDLAALRPIDSLVGVKAFAGWEQQGRWVGNTILGGVAGHALWRRAIEGAPASIAENAGKRSNHMTGPRYLTRLLQRDATDVTLYPQAFFYPYGHAEIRSGAADYADAYTVHHWWHKRTLRDVPLEEGVRGKVEAGSGRALGLMQATSAGAWAPLGYLPVYGTLNVNVGRAAREAVKAWPGVEVDVGFGDRVYRPALLDGRPCHVRLSRSSRTVELVAAQHLRSTLELSDGADVALLPR